MTEQELILTSLLNCERTDLYAKKKVLTPAQENSLEKILKRRKSHEPLQYILGSCEFLNTTLKVDKRVLIPRPETEILVEAVIKRAQQIKSDKTLLKILDIGTGSGNIAIALARNIPCGRIVSVDISGDALNTAKVNAELNEVSDKINFIQSDVFAALYADGQFHRTFDIIVSNPPYISTADMAYLPLDVAQEPKIALDGGVDGLDFYRRIIAGAPDFLKTNGRLFLEIGDGQKFFLEKIFAQHKQFQILECLKDYTNTDRVIIAELTNG